MKIEIRDIFGEIIFEHECENNSVMRTVDAAVDQIAYLSGANLSYANLSYANLRGAYLSGADLRDANLVGADLRDAKLPHDIPVIHDIHKKIYASISANGNSLDMRSWHTCETTHCRAGWAIHLAGKDGYELEKKYDASVAGALIYQASDPNLERIPDWYASNEDAMADIKKMAGII